LPDVPQHTCTVNAEDAEHAVWEAVVKLLQEPERLAQAWTDLNTTELPNQREIKRLEHRSRKLERPVAAPPGCFPGWLAGERRTGPT
jgi:hypothetical protein